jgi:hypothetical protein
MSMVRISGEFASTALLAGMLAACGSGGSGTPAGSGPVDAGGQQEVDATSDSGGGGSPSGDGAGGQDTGSSADGGGFTDGGGEGGDGGDAGLRDIGSCCSAQTTPGCDDPDLEVCVCQMDSTCCTTAWALQCTYLVEQKYCQPGVRDCVCGSDAGQWDQTTCCTTDWTSTCDSVATLKCGAAQGCF